VCVPRGACCVQALTPNGAPGASLCVVLTRARCVAEGGAYLGDNSACAATNPCPAPPARGACCVTTNASGNVCIVLTEAQCTAIGGTWQGANAACTQTTCGVLCRCDYNADGVTDMADLFAFIDDYMAGDADFNNDNATNAADVAAFVDCFFSTPPACRQPNPGGGPG